MTRYEEIVITLKDKPKTWLITGVAGFIGSNLLETLLKLDQTVVGLDNFSTGYLSNLDEVKDIVEPNQWNRFKFLEGDIRNLESCRNACEGVDFVLHQAALGSVPRSINDPIMTNQSNIDGFLNMLVAARDAQVKSFTYAASSSTYGDHPALPKVEDTIGNPMSPYAVTKYVNELYAQVFARCYDFQTIGLRYFNVFGPRQDPNGAYAAVIPKWISALISGDEVFINGDGDTSRDFTYVLNAVQANLLAACAIGDARNQIYNVAVGDRTKLNDLFYSLLNRLVSNGLSSRSKPTYLDFRPGDVRHSQADISKSVRMLGYAPNFNLVEGIKLALEWYIKKNKIINKNGY